MQKFLNNQEPKIEVSLTLGNKHQNQVSESINERIKTFTKDIKAFKEWRKTVPNKFKYLTINNKSRNTEFRRLLFKSQFFKP